MLFGLVNCLEKFNLYSDCVTELPVAVAVTLFAINRHALIITAQARTIRNRVVGCKQDNELKFASYQRSYEVSTLDVFYGRSGQCQWHVVRRSVV